MSDFAEGLLPSTAAAAAGEEGESWGRCLADARRGRLACSARRAESCSALLLLLAVGFALVVTAGHDALSAVVRAEVMRQSLVDSPSAPHFASFVDSDDPKAGQIFSAYTFFNLTNARDVVLRGARPRFELVGPVSFRYHNTKFDVRFDDQRESVEYRQFQHNTPVSDADALLMEAPIVGVDLVLLAALNPNQPLSSTVPLVYPQSTNPEALFLTRPAREWLFGFAHPYLPDPQAPLSGQPARFPGVATNDSSLAAANATHGANRVATGKGGGSAGMMEFVAYDAQTSTTCCRSGLAGETGAAASGNCQPLFGTWAGDAVRGNIGTQFSPFVDPLATLRLATFDFGMLRAWPMVCGRVGQGLGPGLLYDASDLTDRIGACDSYDVQGIRLNRYSLPSYVMGNASVSAAEAEAFGNADGPSGLLNQTNCEQYAPTFISRPFFLYASDTVKDALERLPDEGDERRHGSFLALEPVSGRVLDFAFRAQINALVRETTVDTLAGPVSYFAGVARANTTGVFFPLLWGEQHAQVTPTQAVEFTGNLYTGLKLLAAVRWIGLALCVASILGAMFLRCVVAPRFERAAFAGGGEADGGRGLDEDAIN